MVGAFVNHHIAYADTAGCNPSGMKKTFCLRKLFTKLRHSALKSLYLVRHFPSLSGCSAAEGLSLSALILPDRYATYSNRPTPVRTRSKNTATSHPDIIVPLEVNS